MLTLDGDNIVTEESAEARWSWLDISSPISRCSEKVVSLLSSRQFSIMKIPVRDVYENLSKGAFKPYEAIFVSSKNKSQRSLGFGEEAVQSILGKIGSQDVNDVLAAVDHVINMGLAYPSKIAVLGGSHGGFLVTHLISQVPDKFAAAAARNPVCNLALMVGTADIPEWCYVETFGDQGKSNFTEAPSAEHLAFFYSKSPISHISKVKTPIILLLGAKDLRVPGLQYARALKEKSVAVIVMVFPEDSHAIDRTQSRLRKLPEYWCVV